MPVTFLGPPGPQDMSNICRYIPLTRCTPRYTPHRTFLGPPGPHDMSNIFRYDITCDLICLWLVHSSFEHLEVGETTLFWPKV